MALTERNKIELSVALKNELTLFQYQLKKHYDEKLKPYLGKKIVNGDGSLRKGVDVPMFKKEPIKLGGFDFMADFHYSVQMYGDGKVWAWCRADVHCGEAFGFYNQREESSVHIYTAIEGRAEVTELDNQWIKDHPIYEPDDVLEKIADANDAYEGWKKCRDKVPSSFRQFTKK